MTTLANLSRAALATVYNTAIVEIGAPEGFGEVSSFKSKAAGVTAIEALCAAGNMAVTFNGDDAIIVDAMGEGEGDDASAALGDGKGKARAWGFVTASAEWLKANPRHSEAREAYRTERRKAARMARKADRKAKADAQADAQTDAE